VTNRIKFKFLIVDTTDCLQCLLITTEDTRVATNVPFRLCDSISCAVSSGSDSISCDVSSGSDSISCDVSSGSDSICKPFRTTGRL
jgi:hypothetical protein